MTYIHKSGRTIKEVYEELHSAGGYGASEHGAGTEVFIKGCKTLLDVGGGRSPYARRVQALLKLTRVAVCDISDNAIRAQKEAGTEAYQVDMTEGLPFSDGEFDVVCAFDVLEHIQIESVDFVIQEMARVAKSKLVFTIAYRPANRDYKHPDEPLHLTVKPREWWLERITKLLGCEVKAKRNILRYKHGKPRYGESFLIDL